MKTVAIIGASANKEKFGNKAVRAYQEAGWQVYPVNPKEKEIEGLKAYKSVSDIPVILDRVSLYLPPTISLQVIEEIADKKPGEVFFNPGSESDELTDKAKSLGISPIFACSIVEIGKHPDNFK